jgi:uncharacterized membrane protein required for colicin V production
MNFIYSARVSLFDLVVVGMLIAGLFVGRRRGMSQELIDLIKWLTIVFVAAFLYKPLGAGFGRSTTALGPLSSYLIAYLTVVLGITIIFGFIKREMGGKLLGSDVFGQAEYYLGMGSGIIRFACMLVAALALLNARQFSQTEIRARDKYVKDVYGGEITPTLQSVQNQVFEKSFAGSWVTQNLDFLLISRTPAQPSVPVTLRDAVPF